MLDYLLLREADDEPALPKELFIALSIIAHPMDRLKGYVYIWFVYLDSDDKLGVLVVVNHVRAMPVCPISVCCQEPIAVELDLSGLTSMQVFDSAGRLAHNEVFQASGPRTVRSLELSTLAKSSYSLRVQNGGGFITQTVVVGE